MKKQIAIFIALIITLTAATASYAQTIHGIRAKIPFAFETNGKTLPAGEYVVQRNGSQSLIWQISGKSNKDAVTMLVANAMPKTDREGKSKMVFHRYGSRYFLAAFSTPDYSINLPRSKQERRLLAQIESNPDLARLEVVTLELGVE